MTFFNVIRILVMTSMIIGLIGCMTTDDFTSLDITGVVKDSISSNIIIAMPVTIKIDNSNARDTLTDSLGKFESSTWVGSDNANVIYQVLIIIGDGNTNVNGTNYQVITNNYNLPGFSTTNFTYYLYPVSNI